MLSLLDMTRYFGVFASHHHLRARIVPPAAVPARELQLALGLASAANDASGEPADASPRPRRLVSAALLAQVFTIDVIVCRKCGGRMRILEVVSDPDDSARPAVPARVVEDTILPAPAIKAASCSISHARSSALGSAEALMSGPPSSTRTWIFPSTSRITMTVRVLPPVETAGMTVEEATRTVRSLMERALAEPKDCTAPRSSRRTIQG